MKKDSKVCPSSIISDKGGLKKYEKKSKKGIFSS